MPLVLLTLVFLSGVAHAQNFDVTPDQVFATVGRCTVEAQQLRAALAAAQAKIAEMTKPPPVAEPTKP